MRTNPRIDSVRRRTSGLLKRKDRGYRKVHVCVCACPKKERERESIRPRPGSSLSCSVSLFVSSSSSVSVTVSQASAEPAQLCALEYTPRGRAQNKDKTAAHFPCSPHSDPLSTFRVSRRL